MQTDFLKLVSLNIEKDKHFDRILPFLKKQQPDVILLQEVLSKDIPRLESELEMNSAFAIMKILLSGEDKHPYGLAAFSSLPMTKNVSYYRGDGENVPVVYEGNPINTAQAILETTILKDQKEYHLVNTHFTWTPDGHDTPLQHQDLKNLLQLLDKTPEFVLCGDLNAPRGRVIFDQLASRYKDNIPPHITTTLDKNLHKAGDLQLVVDGLFSTPQYHVESVELFEGLSDHYAVSAKVSL